MSPRPSPGKGSPCAKFLDGVILQTSHSSRSAADLIRFWRRTLFVWSWWCCMNASCGGRCDLACVAATPVHSSSWLETDYRRHADIALQVRDKAIQSVIGFVATTPVAAHTRRPGLTLGNGSPGRGEAGGAWGAGSAVASSQLLEVPVLPNELGDLPRTWPAGFLLRPECLVELGELDSNARNTKPPINALAQSRRV